MTVGNFRPFGESWFKNNATSNWVFTTYERDRESQNDYALARSYASGQARFLSPDPLEGHVGDPQSWNRYAYVVNDPVNLSDPSGQGFWDEVIEAFGFDPNDDGAQKPKTGYVLGSTEPIDISNATWLSPLPTGPSWTASYWALDGQQYITLIQMPDLVH
jgi:RHS repeat-associated protein